MGMASSNEGRLVGGSCKVGVWAFLRGPLGYPTDLAAVPWAPPALQLSLRTRGGHVWLFHNNENPAVCGFGLCGLRQLLPLSGRAVRGLSPSHSFLRWSCCF